jgi:hypothetical protein
VWAHEGDASRDAELYDSVGGRTNVAIYETLYGLHPAVVKTLSKSVFKSKEHQLTYSTRRDSSGLE